MLKIQLLGDFMLTHNGAPVTGVNTARLQSLLAYLALHRNAPQPRRQLAFLLWPDSTEAQALTNLRKAVHHLRRALPQAEDFLAAGAKTVQWKSDAPFTLDVSEFLAAIDAGVLQKAVALYHGDLLSGCYDDWIIPEREHLQQMLISALEKLMLQLEAARDYAGAIGYAHRLVQRDPLREEFYRHLMRLHAANDDRAAALHVYHTCVTTLGRDLNVEPSPLTREMYERLIDLPARPTPAATETVEPLPASVLPLVGREREWSLLQSVWCEASARPRLVLIKGEAGIGKTRLAEALIEWVRRQGMAALTAHCYAEGQPAYAPIAEWLRDHPLHGLDDVWLTELARLLPEILIERPDLPRPEPLLQDWQRLRLFKALAHALVYGAKRASLLLFMDDLHWCDRDTLDWLHYLLQTPLEPSLPLVVIGTAHHERNPSLDSLQARLARADQLIEIELGPLAQPATLTLARHVAGRALNSELGARLYQGTEGNPLFVVEMVRAGLSQAQALPAKVRQVIEARLAQLSPSARELVDLAAVIGRAFTFDVLARACGVDEETLVCGLDELWQRRVVREQGEAAYDFTHDKLREVAYTNLRSARRRLLHRQVAEALEAVHAQSLDAGSGQIARHYEMAGRLETAVRFYERATQAAFKVYANQDALELAERAMTLIEQLPPSDEWQAALASLCEMRADILERSGQHDAARAAYGCAVDQTPESATVLRARLFRKLGKMAEVCNQYDEALALYDRAETALGRSDFQADRAGWQAWLEIQVERLWVYYYQNAQEPARALIERLQPIVETHGTLAQHADVLRCSGALACRRERFIVSCEMLDQARRALELYLQAGESPKIAQGRFSLGFMLAWHGDLDEAEAQFKLLSELATQMGDAHRRLVGLTYQTVIARKRGQVEETRRRSQQALELAEAAQISTYVAAAQANLAWVAWRSGNLDEAEKQSCAALEGWEQENEVFPFLWLTRFPLMRVALTRQQVEIAISQARALLAPDQERLPTLLEHSLEQALAAWEQGQLQFAKLYLEQALTYAQQAQYL